MLRPLAIILILAFSSAAFALPEYPPLDAKGTAEFDRQWTRLQSRPPNSGAREIHTWLLTAVARGWRPEKWAEVIALGEELHDADTSSQTYGNYRWYWREPKPNDRNAVEFSMQCASLTWAAYHDRLPPDAMEKLATALLLGAEGMVRHKIGVSYTNIFLMRLANCILVGEALHRPDLVAKGEAWFDEWLAYTRQNGIHEFSSPTYYGTDLADVGALVNFSQTPRVRAQAEATLRLLWADIAANWFEPYQGIAGSHSRDYGFLTGHGYLDQPLMRAGWLNATQGESHPAIDDLTFVAPPAELRDRARNEIPRIVTQRWGDKPWERATHYVGREFTLGTSGAGYGAQDKVLALTLAGGPKLPLVAFALDYRNDPYGQSKSPTADGHSKLTHLLPFVASVQRGPEALLVAVYDPARARNPIGGRTPIDYVNVEANIILPAAASVHGTDGALPGGAEVSLNAGQPLFLRHGSMAAALLFVGTATDTGQPAAVRLVRDGAKVGAMRYAARLADAAPKKPVTVAVWVRAADGIRTDDDFAAFRRTALAAAAAKVSLAGKVDVALPGLSGPMQVVVDPAKEQRLTLIGGEPQLDTGILVVNGRDLGGALLK